MIEFPKNAIFKYSWRKYQQRVLDDLEEHLLDDHLHIIAPPGSGKTILGLEVAIRLNKPTLILAPTVAIRNQWIQRFCELFLQTTTTPDWISRDIRNPKFITVVTYQGLHAACSNSKIEDDDFSDEDTEGKENSQQTNPSLDKVVEGLILQKIKTIVADEAHHLKNEWWQTLIQVKEKISPVIVGLTATPPYDVTVNEWQRYIDLNGPVDTEISVPELVIEGDLCPHQDYLHFTLPTEEENKKILDFRNNIEKLYNDVKQDETLISAILQHPIWENPVEHLNWIYSNLSYYSSCLIFLNANEIEIPVTHLEIIGDKKIKVPELSYDWIETLLDFYLNKEKEHFIKFEEHQKKLTNKLRRFGAFERMQINFSDSKRVTNYLKSSISKLNSIKEIVDFEYKQLGQDLRLVILSDFIRKEFFVNESENTLELNKLGVISIFEKLRRKNNENKKLAVLTGSIIIIPQSAFTLFKTKAADYGITAINFSPVAFDKEYILIKPNKKLKHEIVHLVTQLFQCGEIEVLIGTKSLLGEGWDAPAINSLILASFVGSFVLSNQMRGRAIRTQNGNKAKTSNIWHLVCIDQSSPTGGDDFDVLKRRFRSFVGVSFKEELGIENGIERLNLPEKIHHTEAVVEINNKMFELAGNRESLKQSWKTALENGVSLIEEIKIPFSEEKEYTAVKSMYLNKTIGNLLATLGSGLLGFGFESLQCLARASKNIRSVQDLYTLLAVLGVIGIIIFGRLTIKTLELFIKYRDISKDVKQIGDALLNSLIKAGIIHTSLINLKVEASIDKWGAVYCHLEGGSTFDKSNFINALQEIITPIDNPRYVIIRRNKLLFFIKQKDYHSVPEILGRNKKLALFFKNQWQQLVGACDLVFTRTIDGRKLILKSRMKSLAAQFENKIEHVNKWR